MDMADIKASFSNISKDYESEVKTLRQKSLFERLLQTVEKTGDATLRYWLQKSAIKNDILSRREYDKLVRDTAQEVLTHIHATVDASEIFAAIDGIEERLNKLGK